MGSYAMVYVPCESGLDAPKELELNQNYAAFSVLSGKRNLYGIKPIFDPTRPGSDYLTTLVLKKSRGGRTLADRYFSEDGYRLAAWFTPDEIRQLDLDRPLEYIGAESEYLNQKGVKTYRQFIWSETTLTGWFKRVLDYNPEYVLIAID